MPTSQPEPTGQTPSSVERAHRSETDDKPNGNEEGGLPKGPSPKSSSNSTDAHYPAPDALSELFRSSGSSRRTPSSDILQMLSKPGLSPINPTGGTLPGIIANTDDAPTVITQNRSPFSPPAPLPLIATGESASIANRRLGHFELIEAIGSGGMAAVLKARDLELGRIVALKILPPEAARDIESVNRFKQEARAAAMLDHENVARVYYCGEDQGLHFIAFEFVEGDNLRVLIDRRGTISPVDCIRYMIQVAAGLNHAAERGVVHRDIKPSNIIITPDGRAKIVDMGLARHLDSLAVNGGVTQSGVTLGTFDYISPEQALDPRRADVRSDLYSLGCAFYHALTGRPPVPEGTAAKKLYAHQNIEPPDPRLLNPSIPDALAAILSGMMVKNPDQRYQTPTALIADLKGLMEHMKLGTDGLTSDSVVQAVPATQSVLPEPPRVQLSWVLCATAVAIAIAAFAMSSGGSGSRSLPPPWVNENSHQKDEAASGLLPLGSARPEQTLDDGTLKIRTGQELVQALAKPDLKIKKLQLDAGEYDLTDTLETNESWKTLELVGSSHGLTTIKLAVSAREGLLIRADSLVIRGIRFVLQHDQSPVEGVVGLGHPVGLSIQSTGQVTLQNCSVYDPSCSFFDSSAKKDKKEEDAIAVSIASTSDTMPIKVTVTGCAFAPAGIALLLTARSEVLVEDCGFASRTALQIVASKEERGDTAPTAVKLFRSSFMLDPECSAVETGSLADVTAGYCIFASIGKAQTTTPASPMGSVLTITNAKPEGITFAGISGQKNAFYRVNPMLFNGGVDTQSMTLETWKKKTRGEDKDTVALVQRPWAQTDLSSAFAHNKEPWSVFALRIDKEPAVFVEENPPKVVVLGAQFHHDPSAIKFRGQAYPTIPSWPPARPRLNEPTQKVWIPGSKEGSSSELQYLLRTVGADDTILIQSNDLIPIETIELRPRTSASDFRVTFKPAPGYKPILTAPTQGITLDQPLFRLMSGQVTFEGIQFLLKPSLPRNPFKVSAVTIVGGKACTFTDCVFTLAEEDDRVASVVRITDPEQIMAMAEGTSRPVPEITFNQCVIRGKGRGVWVSVSRPVKVELTQTLAAIDGPLFLSEPGGKAVAGARSSLKLNHVTAFVGGSLVEMRGARTGEMRTSGLVPLDVYADDCLFAAVPGAGQPLVELDGVDPTDVKSVLEWEARGTNRYANFEDSAPVVIVKSGGDTTPPKPWDWTTWIANVKEQPAGKTVGKVMFAKSPAGLSDLATIKPEDAIVKELKFPDAPDAKPEESGINKLLPAPFGNEPKSE